MIMDGHRQNFLRSFLADHVLIEDPFDLCRLGDIGRSAEVLVAVDLFGDDIVAQIDAFIADVYAWARNKLFDLLLALSAERALQESPPSPMRAMVLGAYFLFTVSIVLCRVYFPTLPACCGAMRPLEPNRVGDIRACVPEHIA